MRSYGRLAFVLLGVVVLVGGLLIATEAVLALIHRPPWLVPFGSWYAALSQARGGPTLAVGCAMTVTGIGLLLAELRPWPPYRLRIDPADGAGEWFVLRRSAERRLGTVAGRVAGVGGARVRLRGRGTRWRVGVTAAAPLDARAALERALRAELRTLAAPDGSRLRVRLHGSGRRT